MYFFRHTWLPWWLKGKEPACQCRRFGVEFSGVTERGTGLYLYPISPVVHQTSLVAQCS